MSKSNPVLTSPSEPATPLRRRAVVSSNSTTLNSNPPVSTNLTKEHEKRVGWIKPTKRRPQNELPSFMGIRRARWLDFFSLVFFAMLWYYLMLLYPQEWIKFKLSIENLYSGNNIDNEISSEIAAIKSASNPQI